MSFRRPVRAGGGRNFQPDARAQSAERNSRVAARRARSWLIRSRHLTDCPLTGA